jgi:hypothetical protein
MSLLVVGQNQSGAVRVCLRRLPDAEIIKKSGSQNLRLGRLRSLKASLQPVNDRVTSHLFLIKRQCRYCNRVFTPQSHNQKYCSYTCRWNAKIEKREITASKTNTAFEAQIQPHPNPSEN